MPGSPHSPPRAGPVWTSPFRTLGARLPLAPLPQPACSGLARFPARRRPAGSSRLRLDAVVVPQARGCWARRFWAWGGRGACPGGLAESGSWQPEDAGRGAGSAPGGSRAQHRETCPSRTATRAGQKQGSRWADLSLGSSWPDWGCGSPGHPECQQVGAEAQDLTCGTEVPGTAVQGDSKGL